MATIDKITTAYEMRNHNTQQAIADHFGVTTRTVRNWWRKFEQIEDILDQQEDDDLPRIVDSVHHYMTLDEFIVVFAPDVHIPYQDPAVWNVHCQIVEDLSKQGKPMFYVAGGDWIDCPQLSRFKGAKQNELPNLYKQVVRGLNDMMPRLHAVLPKNTPMVYIAGNHERRMPHWIDQNAPSIQNYLELLTFQIREHGFMFAGWQTDMIAFPRILKLHHGKTTAKHAADVYRRSSMHWNGFMGHVHRETISAKSIQSSFEHSESMYMSTGCMSLIHPDWFDGDESPNWQQGFGVAWVRPKQWEVDMQLVSIRGADCRARFGGKEYTPQSAQVVKIVPKKKIA